MPTRDDLSKLDSEYVRELLRSLIYNINNIGGFYVVQQIYELGAILVCMELGEKRVLDRLCFQMFSDWSVLLVARNTLSHNSYDIKAVRGDLKSLYNSTLLVELCRFIFDSEKPAYIVYVWLYEVLRKENIYE